MQILVDAHLTNTYFHLANSRLIFKQQLMIRIVISSFSQNYKHDIYRQR